MNSLAFNLDSVLLTCGRCDVEFAIPGYLYKSLIQDSNKNFYCPNGHKRHFVSGPTKLEQLEKRLAFEKTRRESAERDRERARHAEAIAKGKLKAQSQRVKAGVCPCCNRTFKQLARHMASKHPDWSAE